MKKVNDTFDAEMLHGIDKMDLSEARSHCVTMIENTSTREPKKQHLLRDIQKAPSSKEVSRIMWNVMLAGEGLYSITSSWKR